MSLITGCIDKGLVDSGDKEITDEYLLLKYGIISEKK